MHPSGEVGRFKWAISCRRRVIGGVRQLGCTLRLAHDRLRLVHDRCAWSMIDCAWSMLGFARPCWVASVRILMARPGYLNALRQNGPSPKIVLDSNLNATENAANGKTFVIHCRPFRQRCISHLRRSPNKSMHRSRVLRGFW